MPTLPKKGSGQTHFHPACETLNVYSIPSFLGGAMTPTSAHVRGINLDPQTRCAHYHGPTDIVAIRMKCCGIYYACKDCHEALAGHPVEVWLGSEWNQEAILCGACGTELTIRQYLECDSCCPTCRERFNPGCRNHYHFYFEAGQFAEPRQQQSRSR